MEAQAEYVDTTSRRFLVWVNDRFREYLSPIPDNNAEPCFGADGKVKKRGPWDTGSLFSEVASSGFHLMPHQQLVRELLYHLWLFSHCHVQHLGRVTCFLITVCTRMQHTA